MVIFLNAIIVVITVVTLYFFVRLVNKEGNKELQGLEDEKKSELEKG